MTKKKGKRNRLNRNTVKLANDNVKGEREIKGWINRYADQRRGGGKRIYGLAGNRHLLTGGTKGTRRLADKKNGYADWRTKRIYRLAKIGSNKKRISRLAANRFADLAATGYWGYT